MSTDKTDKYIAAMDAASKGETVTGIRRSAIFVAVPDERSPTGVHFIIWLDTEVTPGNHVNQPWDIRLDHNHIAPNRDVALNWLRLLDEREGFTTTVEDAS